MIGSVRKLDSFLIDCVQDAYLWLYDWTGVYVATVTFVLFCLDIVLWSWPDLGRPVMYVIIGLWGFVLSIKYYQQDKGNLQALNAAARFWRDGWWRWAMVLSELMFAVRFATEPLKLLSLTASLGWIYLMCAQLRDREPRGFWKLATGGAT